MIGVWDSTGLLTAAVAELPLSVGVADGPAEAMAVVDGAEAAHAALAAGALGLVLVAPDRMREDEITRLAAASGTRPVIALRRRLRAQRSAATAAVLAECSAPPAELESVLRDAVGWIRELTGGALAVDSVATTDAGAIALLTTHDGAPVTVLARPLSGVPDGGVIRVIALAAERRDVEVDEPAGVLRVRVDRDGESVATALGFESPERHALRRIATLEPVNDLADLLHDTGIAARILGSAE
ncbi:MAG: hypothetical protein ABI566_00935 [Pseudolysinimonas sp.]